MVYLDEDYEQYEKFFFTDLKEVFDYFPNLKGKDVCIEKKLKHPRLISIFGFLVSKDELDLYHLNKNDDHFFEQNFLKISCIIPINYKKIGCRIYDSDSYIEWDKVPQVHRHINRKIDCEEGNLLCTHIPEEAKDMKNPILENLKTANSLFLEYNKFLRTGKWDLKEYKHGEEGVKQYYEKRGC